MAAIHSVFMVLVVVAALLLGSVGGQASVPSCSSLNPFNLTSDVSGSLADFSLAVTIGGAMLSPSTEFDFVTGEELVIELVSLQGGNFFRQFLIRLYDPNGSSTANLFRLLMGETDVQILSDCLGQGETGLSQSTNSSKIVVSALLLSSEEIDGLVLEVTAVTQNSVDWYASSFALNAVNATISPPPAVAPSTMMPTTAPDSSSPDSSCVDFNDDCMQDSECCTNFCFKQLSSNDGKCRASSSSGMTMASAGGGSGSSSRGGAGGGAKRGR